jgi:hypothetical protein
LDENTGDLEDGNDDDMSGEERVQSQKGVSEGGEESQSGQQQGSSVDGESVPPWCECSHCRPMSQEIENKCCKLKKCITLSSRFSKICLDPDVLELSHKKHKRHKK